MPGWITKTPTLVILSLLACAGIFLIDVSTGDQFDASLMYMLVLLGLYAGRVKSAYIPFAAVATLLTIAGAVFVDRPMHLGATVIDRGVIILLICGWSGIIATSVKTTEKLLTLSMTDPLTGALNRRQFMQAATAELNRTKRYGFPLTVLMIDIDNFKRINDTYGHAVGDLTIRTLASTTRAALRLPDVLARYGGEEFVIAMPQTAEPEATRVAERLRQNLSVVEIPTKDGPITMTVSIGLAQWMPSESSIDEMIERADQALYVAKRNGKNQVRIAPRTALAA